MAAQKFATSTNDNPPPTIETIENNAKAKKEALRRCGIVAVAIIGVQILVAGFLMICFALGWFTMDYIFVQNESFFNGITFVVCLLDLLILFLFV